MNEEDLTRKHIMVTVRAISQALHELIVGGKDPLDGRALMEEIRQVHSSIAVI